MCFFLALLAAACLWFFVDHIVITHQIADAAEYDRPRGNLSDLYPRWLGTRELLLRHRNPYSPEITLEIQQGYYGRVLDPSRPNDPKDRQGFVYPVYVVFLLAPLIGLPFHSVQLFFHWLLLALTAISVLLWQRVLNWRMSPLATLTCITLLLGCIPTVQGIKLQQLSLLVAAMLAISAACIASGWLVSGGVILALATIKPQLLWPAVLWMLVWSLSDWKARRRLAFAFAVTMAILLAGAEFVLPGWWRMFLEAIHQYHQYTQSESVLEQLVNRTAGRFAGDILAAAAVLLSGIVLWHARQEPRGSSGFGHAVALLMALTVLIVPMYAPYNQVLLVPAILLIWRDRASLLSRSGAVRMLYAVAGFALVWPWIASIGLTVTWFISRDSALMAWTLPFYSTFALPVLAFVLALLSAQDALRWRKAAE